MRESDIEKAFVREVKKHNGLPLKLISPGWAGAPDRLVLLPGGRAVFVELKAPGKKPRPLQRKRAAELQALGFQVYSLDSIESVERFIREVVGD